MRTRTSVLALLFGLQLAAPAAAGAATRDPTVVRRDVIGASVDHRAITAVERGDPDSPRKALVVGCIHGNEPAGIAIARALAGLRVPAEVDLWVILDANPDGVRRGTRTNANGVDLNRNFPWRWTLRGRRGDLQYSGPRALSEPESRALAALILRLRPSVSIWFHQPLGVVDESGGRVAVERRYSRLVGLPLRKLTRYRGGVTDWENAVIPGGTAFVVELPPGRLPQRRALRFAGAITSILL